MRVSRPPAPPPPTGEVRFAGHVLSERIAVGGMAEVFRASRSTGDRVEQVVVKRMLPALAADPALSGSMEAEARLGGLVRHPGVVRVLGHGEEGGLPYLVLEHVPGVDLWRLSRALRRQGRTLELDLACSVSVTLARALHAVHEATDERGRSLGLVHRDVSPSNVLVSEDGDVKLADFGIAHAQLAGAISPSGERAKGKLGYLSPEQVRGQSTDRRADVFSLAVIAAELLLGRPLFSGGSELAILLAIREANVKPLDALRATVPDALLAALLAGLASDPDARTPTAGALADALAPFAADAVDARPRLGVEVRAATTSSTGVFRAPEPDSGPFDPARYRVRSAGRELALTYAEVARAIATREVGALDEVAVGHGPFAALTTFPELARHLPPSSLSITREEDHPARADATVAIADGGLVRLFGRLVLEKESGLLLASDGATRKEVYFTAGVPELVSSNVPGELLGEFLVARGVLSRGELDEALALMPRFDGHLGDTLTALGLVEPVYLFRQIGAQVLEKLVDLFAWTSGTAEWFRGAIPQASGFRLDLDPYRVLALGIDRRLALDLEPALDPDVRVVRSAHLPPALSTVALPAAARAVLDRVSRPTTVAALSAEVGDESLDPHAMRRALALLTALGAVTLA